MASSSLLATLLVLSAAALAILAPTCSADSFLLSGHSLSTGASLQYGDFKLTMQSDCNLVLYDYDSPVWSTQTNNKGKSCTLDMQDDGNLVIYDEFDNIIWASNSYRDSELKYILVLQPDRNIVIYGPNLWATATNIDDDGMAAVSTSRNSTKAAAVAGDGSITMVTEK